MSRIHPNWVPNATDITDIPVANGGSKPKVCEFDDKVRRIVKWHPSAYGHTATYSELVASRLGQLIDAPVIRGTLVYIEGGLIRNNIGRNINPGFHLGFTYLDGDNLTLDDYEVLNNKGAIPKAAALLAWLNMGDHENRNKYVRQLSREDPSGEIEKLKEFVLVDMSDINHLSDWTTCGFGSPEKPYSFPRQFRDRITLEDTLVVAEQISELEDEEIRSCLDYYPDEWKIDTEAIGNLAGFLLERRRHLTSILNRGLGFQFETD